MTKTHTPEVDVDPTYASLPVKIQLAIDEAFSSSTAPSINRPSKKRKISSNAGGGGFMLSSPPPDSDDDEGEEDRRLAMDLLPDALARLSLPADPDTISVFKNASTGWALPTVEGERGGGAEGGEGISLADWRSVCAVLLEPQDEDVRMEDSEAGEFAVDGDDDMGGGGFMREEDGGGGGGGFMVDDDDEGGGGGGGFMPQEDDEEDEGEGDAGGFMLRDEEEDDEDKDEYGAAESDAESSDEYQDLDAPRAKPKTVKRASRRRKNVDSDEEELTASQRRAALDTFALFFPDDDEEVKEKGKTKKAKLEDKRLAIKDITKIAGILKEKIGLEEILEMLTTFSTSPDKSMGLADFERMLVATGLV